MLRNRLEFSWYLNPFGKWFYSKNKKKNLLLLQTDWKLARGEVKFLSGLSPIEVHSFPEMKVKIDGKRIFGMIVVDRFLFNCTR